MQKIMSEHADETKEPVKGPMILKRSTTHPYVAHQHPSAGGFFSADAPPFHVWTRADAEVEVTDVQDRPGGDEIDSKYGEDELKKKPKQCVIKFADAKDPANPFKDAKTADGKEMKFLMYVLPSDLKPIATKAAPTENKFNDLSKLADINAFFDPTKNAIISAWQSTRGRGLAGFISSLDFDYNESTYETTSLTRRAPKMVKISIQFEPIHDIAPGMDHHGGFRAPIYPVGDVMSHYAGDELANTLDYGFKNPGTFKTGTETPESAHDNFIQAVTTVGQSDKKGKKDE